jgi:hypothetical protein
MFLNFVVGKVVVARAAIYASLCIYLKHLRAAYGVTAITHHEPPFESVTQVTSFEEPKN